MSDDALARIRAAGAADGGRLEAPVFTSFRELLGNELYERIQANEDRAQGALLASLLAPGSEWEVYVAEVDGAVAGFVSLRMDGEALVGEIGLNAVDPAYARRGIGTGLCEFALGRMKDRGMRVSCRGSRIDPSLSVYTDSCWRAIVVAGKARR